MLYQRILLAYDGSRESQRVLFECGKLTEPLDTEFHLLAVKSAPPAVLRGDGFLPEKLVEQDEDFAKSLLNEGILALRRRGLRAVSHFSVGAPIEEICNTAMEYRVDLIVVGHRQTTSFARRWWSSSMCASLLDCAPCSILVVI